MRKYFFILILILNLHLQAANIEIKTVADIFIREKIDLDAKSLKGWMRVFNSNSKLNDYDIYVTKEERESVLLYLNILYKEEYKEYSKVVR